MSKKNEENKQNTQPKKEESKQNQNEDLTLQDFFLYILKFKLKHVISVLILGISILVYYKYNEKSINFNILSSRKQCVSEKINLTKPLKYKVYGKNPDDGHLKHVYAVLDRLGYQRDNDENSTDWDLLWAHDYPFRVLYSQIYNAKSYQRVNHFPGCGYITNKVDLSTTKLRYILPAFKLPEQKNELLDYVKDNPEKMFVEKSNDHRNIKIQEVRNINLDKSGTFVQEYVDKPFLVDGYKFDIGVYTIITSIDPLRVYIFNGDVLFRYCMHQYYPFNSSDIDKYVVGDDYLPTWEVPSLKKLYTELGFSMRESFDAYVRSQGKDPQVMWEKIEDALRNVILNKEESIINIVNRFKSSRNFFEMMRFDFVVDENLNVYLMEANMSPNLSSAHYPPNQRLYEQVLHSLFSLLGFAMRPHCCKEGQNEMSFVPDKGLFVFPQICNSSLCKDSCLPADCQLCYPCLSKETKLVLARAYIEHMNRKDCKRIFPPPIAREDIEKILEVDVQNYSVENQLMYRWFLGKCQLDKSWC